MSTLKTKKNLLIKRILTLRDFITYIYTGAFSYFNEYRHVVQRFFFYFTAYLYKQRFFSFNQLL